MKQCLIGLLVAMLITGVFAGTGNLWAAPKELPNPFFAMDTGTKDAKHATPEAQAAMLKELGYAGIGYTGVPGLKEMLAALDAQGLKLFTVYLEVEVGVGEYALPDGLHDAMAILKGRGTVIWLTVKSDTFPPGSVDADETVITMLHELSDWAQPAGVRIALYPHANTLVDSVYSVARLSGKAARPNVGGTFNLCHWLMVEKGQQLETLLRTGLSALYMVTINGADLEGGWDKLIQPLDSGTFDVEGLLMLLKELGYTGPIGLQGYGIPGDVHENLRRSMDAWRKLSRKSADDDATTIRFKDFSDFRESTGAWTAVGDAFTDPQDEKRLERRRGLGAALNGPDGKTKHLITQREFGDVEAHIEFMVPKGSNSGVYFQGRYEIQVLDSWGVSEPKYGDCGGIYQRWHEEPGLEENQRGFEGRAPRVNAAREPGKWQSFDVIFRAPRFDANGTKIANAMFVEVKLNGVVLHENQEVTGPTRAALFNDEQPLGPLMLQGDHGPVAYRNLRLRPLADR